MTVDLFSGMFNVARNPVHKSPHSFRYRPARAGSTGRGVFENSAANPFEGFGARSRPSSLNDGRAECCTGEIRLTFETDDPFAVASAFPSPGHAIRHSAEATSPPDNHWRALFVWRAWGNFTENSPPAQRKSPSPQAHPSAQGRQSRPASLFFAPETAYRNRDHNRSSGRPCPLMPSAACHSSYCLS